jgi:hypothetical protein
MRRLDEWTLIVILAVLCGMAWRVPPSVEAQAVTNCNLVQINGVALTGH